MHVRKQGRYVETTSDELDAWQRKESGKPVHVATENTDLTAELKRGLSFLRSPGSHHYAETGAAPYRCICLESPLNQS
jgi:hypothetical protein